MFGEQLADYEEYFGACGVVGEAARVGHHAAVKWYGALLGDILETAELPYQAEHQLASAARLGV